MPTSSYKRGYLAELEIVHILQNIGFEARREFRSGNNWFGKFQPRGDIIATHPDVGLLLIEVKRWVKRNVEVVRVEKDELQKLRTWTDFYNHGLKTYGVPIHLMLAIRFPRKTWIVQEIPLYMDPTALSSLIFKRKDATSNGFKQYILQMMKQVSHGESFID